MIRGAPWWALRRAVYPDGPFFILGEIMPEGEEQGAHSQDSQVDQTPGSQCCSLVVKNTGRRKDTGRLHAVRHGALSRYPLEALRHLGENSKSLRRMEQRFRTELKPHGEIAEVVFDRFWSSYLRCLNPNTVSP